MTIWHTWSDHVTHLKWPCDTPEVTMRHTWSDHVTHLKWPWDTPEVTMWHAWSDYVTRLKWPLCTCLMVSAICNSNLVLTLYSPHVGHLVETLNTLGLSHRTFQSDIHLKGRDTLLQQLELVLGMYIDMLCQYWGLQILSNFSFGTIRSFRRQVC